MPSIIGKALLSGEIECHYQPIVNIHQKEILYYETLVRRKNKDGILIGPLDFLHTIEKKKLAAHLTQEVFWQSSKKFSDNQEHFSLNLPLIAVSDKSTSMMLESMIRNSNFSERIIFEIQASEWIYFQEVFSLYIHKLKDLGVRFAIDDFAHGKFSFEMLDYLETDIIKIDGKFFKSGPNLVWKSTIVRSIVEYAHKNNMITIAEEIDSYEAFHNAQSYGVDNMQGFYIQRPASWDTMENKELDWLQKW